MQIKFFLKQAFVISPLCPASLWSVSV